MIETDYSIPDLKKSEVMRHLSFANMYGKVAVCCYCKSMYDKIDYLRVNSNNDKNVFLDQPEKIPEEIGKYLSDRDRRDRYPVRPDRRIFSQEFYEELDYFDLPPQIDPPFKLEKDLMTSFYKDMEERKERKERVQRSEMVRQSESVASYMGKKVKDVTLKMHLGSREGVSGSDLGAITSSASLRLANVQSVDMAYHRK